jgi:thiamine transport system ATP-binding protein
VDGVDLTVAAGEVVCLLGPSGCGKTTLLRAVAGLVEPAAGGIAWDGSDLAGVPPHRRRMGLMFQDYALFPHLDVAANVGFGLRMQGLPAAMVASRAAEALELVGLGGQGRRPVGSLSGGEQQRVALARALAPEPRLLLLDEPLAALDRGLRARLLAELVELLDRLDVTALHVTHDQEEAFALGDRVAVMEAGRIVQVDTPEALWRAPGTAAVARFLGFPVLDATVVDGRATAPWGTVPAPGAPDGPSELVLRPDALSLATSGPLCGTVTATTFRGDRLVVRVSTAAGPLDVTVEPGAAPEVGATTGVAVEPARVVVLPVGGGRARR